MRSFWGAVYVLSVAFWVFAAAPSEDLVAHGRRVASTVRPACRTCHAEGAAFSGSRADARAWIRTPAKMFKKTGKRGKMPAYSKKQLSDDDMEALIEYILANSRSKK